MDMNVDLLQWLTQGISKENKELAEESHKPINRKFKKQKIY